MANHTERIGVYHCAEIVEANGWMFREQPVDDVGIDAHMEYIDNTGKLKQLLALQIKSGLSWFKEEVDGNILFRRINERQYQYWTMNFLPCILVLYNPVDGRCIWQKLSSETIKRTKDGSGEGFFVKVPIDQIFINEETNKKLLNITYTPEYITNYNFLLSQKKFMEIIKEGGTVRLHSKEWVNKSNGKGKIELLVDEGENSRCYIYPYWFPYMAYTDVFPILFPWATFTVDDEFIYESDLELWKELNCFYDKDCDEWINVGSPFEEFRKDLDPMRSIDHAGEVAEYMFVLGLNELGYSFLKINEFVTQTQIYQKTRPMEMN